MRPPIADIEPARLRLNEGEGLGGAHVLASERGFGVAEMQERCASIKLLHVVGARPNFPKLAPVYRAAERASLAQFVVHTGQHYDEELSGGFFRDLCIPAPNVNLAVGSETHAVQTARIMERFEPVLLKENPDFVLVYGDVNSTVAAALVASKHGVPIAHVEAGLRSHDRTMPEEINRIVTDRLANLLLTPSRDADDALRAEGEPDDEIVFVGNVMIDSLFFAMEKARQSDVHVRMGIPTSPIVVTLHRPSNVDLPERLAAICEALRELAIDRPVIFPAHPRTQQRLARLGPDLGQVRLLKPLSYVEMVALVMSASVVITDSGGLQEETTALGIPCLTLRENTERPITITEGTNRLVSDPRELPWIVRSLQRADSFQRPEGWDGHAGERVVAAVCARITANRRK